MLRNIITALKCPPKNRVIFLFGGLLVVELLWQTYKRTIHVKNKKSKSINEVLFFSEESSGCRLHSVSRVPCDRSSCSITNLRKLTACLESAEKTLHICIYLFTCDDIAAAILRVFSRGVNVKIIIDGGMSENVAFDQKIRAFRKKGIRVRTKKSTYLMHHKFALVDGDILLTGSTNWTMQALYGNWDNVIITNNKAIVIPFVKEFDRMWWQLTKDEE